MNKFQILSQVLVLIQTDKEKYICDAIREVLDSEWDEETDKNCAELKSWIHSLLERHGTLEGWLSAKGFNPKLYPEKVRQTRIAWVRWMRAQYEAQADKFYWKTE